MGLCSGDAEPSKLIPLSPLMIDTHSHIYGPEFDEDRTLVVERARQAGVEAILLPNINADSIFPMLTMCRDYPGYCYPMMGLHPEDVKEDFAERLDEMEGLLRNESSFIAVGEVGLDFYWDVTYKDQQLAAFERQVCWARDFGLPLVIHCRSAHRELVALMEKYRGDGLSGVFHCFGGTLEEAEELLSFPNFVLGIGGVVTYKKSTLPDVLNKVPLGRIVTETDSPYLAPVPNRGKRNESAYVSHVVRRLSEIYACSEADIDKVTTNTAKKLFRLAI